MAQVGMRNSFFSSDITPRPGPATQRRPPREWASRHFTGRPAWTLSTPASATRTDGAVSIDDMVMGRRHLSATGGGAGWRDGDFDHDGRVGPQDLLLLRGNYGVRIPAGAQAASVTLVPEPGGAATLLPLAALVLRRRRRATTGSARRTLSCAAVPVPNGIRLSVFPQLL